MDGLLTRIAELERQTEAYCEIIQGQLDVIDALNERNAQLLARMGDKIKELEQLTAERDAAKAIMKIAQGGAGIRGARGWVTTVSKF